LAGEFLIAIDTVTAPSGQRAADGGRLGEREQGDGQRRGGQVLDVLERVRAGAERGGRLAGSAPTVAIPALLASSKASRAMATRLPPTMAAIM